MLAGIWNSYLANHEQVMLELKHDNEKLTAEHKVGAQEERGGGFRVARISRVKKG